MLGPSDREAVKAAAVRAVMLLLHLGEESYSDAILIDEGTRLVHSPLAGQRVKCDDLAVSLVGPSQGEGIYHVTMTMRCGLYRVQAYCSVAFHTEPFLIKTDVRVGKYHLSARNVSIRNGELDPWGTPEGYDLEPALQAVSYATSS